MLHKQPFVNYYCHKCRQTHRHEVKGATFQCQRCGTLQHSMSARKKTGFYPVAVTA